MDFSVLFSFPVASHLNFLTRVYLVAIFEVMILLISCEIEGLVLDWNKCSMVHFLIKISSHLALCNY